MGVTWKKHGKKGKYLVTVSLRNQRKYLMVPNEGDAKALQKEVMRLSLNGVDVMGHIEQARKRQQPTPSKLGRLRDALPAYVDAQVKAGDLRVSSAKRYKGNLKRWFYDFDVSGRKLGDLSADQVTREMLGACITAIKSAGRSMSVVDGVTNPIRSYLRLLVETKQLLVSPADNLSFFRGRGGRKRQAIGKVFSSAEVKKLIDTSRKVLPRWTVFLELAVATGARWGELVALHKSDLDLERQRITISKTVSDGKVIAETKTSKSRQIPISDAMTKTLAAHLKALESKSKKWSPAARELVFPTMRGHVLSYSNWNMLWKPLMAKTGMTYRPFHALRHTCASAMLEAGVDIRYVQHIMGHASIQMTSDIYGHLRPEAHVNGANKVMDAFINGKR
jgi:integrase